MLNELRIELEQNKKEILNVMNKELSNINPDMIQSKWASYTFPEGPRKPVIAVDGSVNNINFVAKALYATSSHAVYSTSEGLTGQASINKIELLPNMPDLKKVFSKQMALMELKTILHVLHTTNAKYVLIDGDLYSMIDHINRGVPHFSTKNKFIKEYTQQIVEEEENNFGLEVPSIAGLLDELEEHSGASLQIILYSQMIRELCVLKKILNDYSDRVISISKTSITKGLYHHEHISDLALINIYCENIGYSHELSQHRLSLNPLYDMDYPIYNDFFRSLDFTTRFVRLTGNGAVLKVQLPGHPSEEEFRNVFTELRNHALDSTGYPFVLKRVHDKVKISSMDMQSISGALGLNYELKERNML